VPANRAPDIGERRASCYAVGVDAVEVKRVPAPQRVARVRALAMQQRLETDIACRRLISIRLSIRRILVGWAWTGGLSFAKHRCVIIHR
jgi:hypothetical protein